MKIKMFSLYIILTVTSIFAHRTILMVEDNGDGTLYIEAGLSTGKTAEGAKLTLLEKSSGKPLWQGVIPDSGNLSVPQPTVPYNVTLKMSKGHEVTKTGPVAQAHQKDVQPKESQLTESSVLEIEEAEKSSFRLIVTFSVMIIAAAAGFYKSFKKRV